MGIQMEAVGMMPRCAEEAGHIRAYLEEIRRTVDRNKLNGEILLYITPPEDLDLIDEYFSLGASRIACSLEVWDPDRAAVITPGKIAFYHSGASSAGAGIYRRKIWTGFRLLQLYHRAGGLRYP